ncbi:MAG: alanine racemase [Oscillospiraceae bacterium]|jgi:alanine racemase|nr:alanine racemase [Oscillospiraceae bacterium]
MDFTQARTWAEIDLRALEHNYETVTSRLHGGASLLAVLKADAYGHGAVAVAKTLLQCADRATPPAKPAPKSASLPHSAAAIASAEFAAPRTAVVPTFAVATLPEAVELREAGVAAPILILGVTPPEFTGELIARGIIQTVTDFPSAQGYSTAAAALGKTLNLHAKLDTGMGRLGFQSPLALALAMKLPALNLTGAYTHFAVADEADGADFTRRQFHEFEKLLHDAEHLSGKRFRVRHCANSGGTLNFPEFQLDLARAGILLYGYPPGRWMDEPAAPEPSKSPKTPKPRGLDLSPVMRLKTRVAQLKNLSPGDRVSYGGVFEATRPGRAAILPIGYADGLHRSLSGKLEVLLNGRRARQIGRVCMDLCVVDVTDIPDAAVGDVATVFGGAPAMTAWDVAELADTVPYEILCAVSARVPRVYLGA